MSLFPIAGATIKGRVVASFPVSVVGTGGIAVSKDSGIWTIEPAFDELTTIEPSSATNPSTKQIWIYDPVTDEYNVMTLAGLGDALYVATSTTSLAIGTGSKVFTTQAGKGFAVGGFVLATSDADPTDYMLGQVTAYSGTTLTISVASSGVGGSGTLADWTIRAASPAGAQGATGDQGAAGASSGIAWDFDNSTSMADPGTGNIRLNHGTLTSVTAVALSALTAESGNPDISDYVVTWDDSTSTVKGHVIIRKTEAPENFAIYAVTGTVTDNTDWLQIAVTNVASNGSFTDGDELSLSFTRVGDKGTTGDTGATGATGATGSTGPTGATPGIKQAYDNSTTDADPGNGEFRLNNATPASATEAYLDNLDGGGATVSGIIDLWDDSSSTVKGHIRFEKSTDPTVWAEFRVTGSVVDGTGYRKLTLTAGAGSGAFSNGDTFAITFTRTGDQGAAGAGSGDMLAANNLNDVVDVPTARANLGLTIGTHVQAYDAELAAIAALAVTDGNIIVGNGSTWVAESGPTARASLGLAIGTDVQAYDADTAKLDVAQTWSAKQTFGSIIEIEKAIEQWNIVADNLASGDNNFDVLTNAVWYWTTAGDTNATLNFRGDGSNSLDSLLDVGDAITVAAILTHTGTAYYVNALKIDGSSVTPKWVDGTAPSAGSINALDVYTFTILKTASATFTVFAQKVKWDEA